MTGEQGQEGRETTNGEAHACPAASAGAPARARRTCREARYGPDTLCVVTACAPDACREARCGPDSIGVTACATRACRETHDGSDFGVTARGPRVCREVRPGASPRRRRGCAAVVGAGQGAHAGGAAAAGCDYDALVRPAVGDKRRATLRRVAASQTETAGPAPFPAHGRSAGEGAR
ncbi:DUF6380 family protein [Streptomyces sp. CA-179760]|uniref:DUF6380 family protein n=1 Tax=Streptomyces sp. CA-179760 TaxID=3240054 RepID=UPI003D935A28